MPKPLVDPDHNAKCTVLVLIGQCLGVQDAAKAVSTQRLSAPNNDLVHKLASLFTRRDFLLHRLYSNRSTSVSYYLYINEKATA